MEDDGRRVRALLKRCCHGHCSADQGHACDRPPALRLEAIDSPGSLDARGPLAPEVQATLGEASRAGLTRDNAVQLLLDGVQSYSAMLELVESAETEILFENFILRADAVGLGFTGELRRRASEGVSVRILHDPLGSRFSTIAHAFRFRGSAAQLRVYNPPRPTAGFFRGGRDHRKLVVQDRRRMVVGGMCVADLWVGNCISRCTWRDSAVLVEGAASMRAAAEFESMWLSGVPLSIRTRRGPERGSNRHAGGQSAGEVPVRVVADLPRRRAVERMLAAVFAAARREIRVTNSYFVPTPRIVSALIDAARRGVDVEILLPGASDHPLVDLASEHLLGELLEAGVRVWRWTGPMIHAKTVVVDQCWSLVGSSNLDAFSLCRNAELNVEMHGARVGEQMAQVFERDRAQATPLTWREWGARSGSRRRLARMLAAARAWM